MEYVHELLEHLDKGHQVPVYKFMDIALYARDGYYNQNVRIGGDDADFYTAAVSPLFAYTLANVVHKIWRLYGSPSHLQVVELGAGQGTFAKYMIDRVGLLMPDVHIEYVIVEKSLRFTQLQQTNLRQWLRFRHCGDVLCRWGQPNPNLDTVVIGNEVMDAFPVERVQRKSSGWMRGYVKAAATEASLHEVWLDAPEWLVRLAEKWLPVEAGEVAELCPDYEKFVRQLHGYGRNLYTIFFDYGIRLADLQSGLRPQGTLRGYSKHQLCHPLQNPGSIDITADVHWDFVVESAIKTGFTEVKIQNQGEFLVSNGIADLLTLMQQEIPDDNYLGQMNLVNQFKQLILPGGFGERFQVFTCRLEK